jgi:O-antigen ligase
LSGSRTATLVLLVLWLATPLSQNLKSRLLASGAMCALGLALFYSPIFQERFFPLEREGSLQQVLQGDYYGSGRFEAWPVVWEGAQKHIVFGAGAGEVGRFAEHEHLPDAVKRPLNDYLRVVFEFGTLGLAILIWTVAKQMRFLHSLIREWNSTVHWALAASYLGFVAFLIFCCTENVLVYGVYFMHPLFAVTGAAIGLTAKRRSAARGAVQI